MKAKIILRNLWADLNDADDRHEAADILFHFIHRPDFQFPNPPKSNGLCFSGWLLSMWRFQTEGKNRG